MASIWHETPQLDEQLRFVVESSTGATWDQVARRLSEETGLTLTEDQVRNRAKRLGLTRITSVDQASEVVAVARLKAVRLAENRDLAAAVKAQGKWEDFLDIVRGELQLPAPSGYLAPVLPAGQGTPETMVVVLSDIHIGKLVRADHTGPGFGYDQDTFVDRGNEVLGTILRLRQIHSAKGPIPKLLLYFLGDGVDGVDMRRGHGKRVDMDTSTQQTLRLAQFFGWLVQELDPYFEIIDIEWDYGNHGRVGDFGVNLPSDNWDFLAGKILEQNVSSDKVSVNVPTQKFSIRQVGPLTVYSAHGDMIRGGGGSPVVKRHVANLQNLHRRQFDLVLLGHFHTSEMFTAGAAKVFMNGAWDGGDDFSVNQLVMATDPAQWAFGVHPRRGVTWSYEMTFGTKRGATPAADR